MVGESLENRNGRRWWIKNTGTALGKILMQPIGHFARKALKQYKSIDDAVELISKSSKITVVAGAGISVSCGIPDFRSPGGFYEMVAKDGISPPESVFTLSFFDKDPSLFYKYQKHIFPSACSPSVTHKFLAKLEGENKLLRLYTQNIDHLESVVGVKRLIQCHGTLGQATCRVCGKHISLPELRKIMSEEKIPHCRQCLDPGNPGILKPDVVLFGENLPQSFFKTWEADQKQLDLLIVIGTSMKVAPVSLMSEDIDPKIPRILINLTPVGRRGTFDINLIGNCDDIIRVLVKKLEWNVEEQPPTVSYSLMFSSPNVTTITVDRAENSASVKASGNTEDEGEQGVMHAPTPTTTTAATATTAPSISVEAQQKVSASDSATSTGTQDESDLLKGLDKLAIKPDISSS